MRVAGRSILTCFLAASVALGAALLPGAVLTTAAAADGTVSGTVTAGGAALDDAAVTALRLQAWGWDWWDSTEAGATGDYEISLSPGTYLLMFEDEDGTYAPQFYDGAARQQDATQVVVSDGASVPGIDAVLVQGAHLTGTVRSPSNDTLGDVTVTAYTEVYDTVAQEPYWSYVGEDTTTTGGLYDIGGLAAGDYVLSFYDGQGRYRHEYYQNARDIEAATPLTVTAAESHTVPDVTLDEYSKISGTVTNGAGAAVPGIDVTAYQWDPVDDWWYSVSWTSTDGSGAYVLGRLEPGQYVVGFHDGTGGLASTYYPNSVLPDGATPVPVGEAATVSGINAVLSPAAHITGRVTSVAGVGSGSTDVWAYAWSGKRWQVVGYTETDASGGYDIDGLHNGIYRVAFYEWDADIVEFWNDKGSLSTADDIWLTTGATFNGVNAEMDDKTTFRNVAAPAISGTPTVGATLTATPGSWTPQGAAFSYQWIAAGVPIAGAVASTYVPSAGDLGKQLTVRVIASRAGMNSGVAHSALTLPVAAAAVPPAVTPSVKNLVKPKIKGMAKVGKTLKVTAGSWNPASVAKKIRWLANGKVIKKATKRKFTVTVKQKGKRIKVRIVASATGHLPMTLTTKPTARVKP
jgi:hypothetical protein